MTSTTCRENKARTEVPEECCENGGLGAFDDDRRDTFMTRSPVLVRFYRSTTETGMKTKPSSQIETRYQCYGDLDEAAGAADAIACSGAAVCVG